MIRFSEATPSGAIRFAPRAAGCTATDLEDAGRRGLVDSDARWGDFPSATKAPADKIPFDPPGSATFEPAEVSAILDFLDHTAAASYPVPGVFAAFVSGVCKLRAAEIELIPTKARTNAP